MFLIHQTESRFRERQKSVIFLIKPEAITREAANEEFQLVISSLGYMDAMSCEEVLQGIGYLLEILIPRNLNHHVIVGIDEHLAVTDDFRLNLFDVLNGNLIVGIGNGGMTVLFLLQFSYQQQYVYLF